MSYLIGGAGSFGWVALKAVLLYVTAIIGFRLGERRTLAEMSAFDFVAAVAVGAIIGRVPNASGTSYAAGAVTLVAILVAHKIVSRLRYFPGAAAVIDHPPEVLVLDGQIVSSALRRSALTDNDLYGILRQHGVTELNELRLVVFEQRGQVSIVRRTPTSGFDSELVRKVLDQTNVGEAVKLRM